MAHEKNKTVGYGKAGKVLVIDGGSRNTAAIAALMAGDFDQVENTEADSKLRVYRPDVASVGGAKPGALVFDWTGDIPVEDAARKQIAEVAQLPFVKRMAVMPDCHYGAGATIGTVIETEGALIPAAVGVDIGCGITAFPLHIDADLFQGKEEAIRQYVQEHIPNGRTTQVTGNSKHAKFDPAKDLGKWGTKYPMPEIVFDRLDGAHNLAARYEMLLQDFEKAGYKRAEVEHPFMREHLGTLGTGNHFIEFVEDEQGRAWILVHSGSRGAGAKLANWAMKRSKALCDSYFVTLPNQDLAYFPEHSVEFTLYLKSLAWATDYAKSNRWIMTMLAADAVEKFCGVSVNRTPASWTNTSHNYVEKTQRGTYITRKGASKAVEGEFSVMPGSMGAKSYLVEGKSNTQSLMSCSHGAGRAMSRGDARRKFTLADLAAQTEGLFCRKDEEVLDETRDAYKPIDQVLAQQDELVEVRRTFKAIINVKG